MPHIHVEHPFTVPKEQVRETVRAIALKLENRLGAATQWNECCDALRIEGSGVNGEIAIHSSHVTVTAELGFMFGLMKDPIEAEIRRVLSENLQ